MKQLLNRLKISHYTGLTITKLYEFLIGRGKLTQVLELQLRT